MFSFSGTFSKNQILTVIINSVYNILLVGEVTPLSILSNVRGTASPRIMSAHARTHRHGPLVGVRARTSIYGDLLPAVEDCVFGVSKWAPPPPHRPSDGYSGNASLVVAAARSTRAQWFSKRVVDSIFNNILTS